MRIAVLSFTGRGAELNRRLCEELAKSNADEVAAKAAEPCAGTTESETVEVHGFEKRKDGDGSLTQVSESLREFTGTVFQNYDALIVVGACGIAVRAVAPWVKDKFTDPAVLSVDEGGQFVVSLLSGHVGGANELALRIAEILGAVPVISTATDVNGLFAVDVFARENGLVIGSRRLAKEFSAALLAGRRLPIYSAFPVSGEMPPELELISDPDEFLKRPGIKAAVSVCRLEPILQKQREPDSAKEHADFSDAERPEEKSETDIQRILYLIPRNITLGLGCKAGTDPERFRAQAEAILKDHGIFPEALCSAASIDLKKHEEAICRFAAEYGLPYHCYTKEELNEVPGSFSESDFVKKTVGVGCVCERAAVRDAGDHAALILPKTAGGGMTLAAAAAKRTLYWKKEKTIE